MLENKNFDSFARPESKSEKERICFESAEFNIPKEGKAISEDSILLNEDAMVFGIFDGMGGHSAGEIASKIASSSVDRNFCTQPENAKTPEEAAEHLGSKLLTADAEIYNETKRDPSKRKMGTTASVVELFTSSEAKKFAILANVGDSRIYLLSKGKLKKLTTDDHSLKQLGIPQEDFEYFESKLDEVTSPEELADIEILAFRNRNILSNYLGRESGAMVKTLVVELSSGDKIIITSDGIHDNLTTSEIESITKKDMVPKDIAAALARGAKDRSEELDSETGERHLRAKRDDMSAIVIEIEPRPGRVSIEDEITQKIIRK